MNCLRCDGWMRPDETGITTMGIQRFHCESCELSIEIVFEHNKSKTSYWMKRKGEWGWWKAPRGCLLILGDTEL